MTLPEPPAPVEAEVADLPSVQSAARWIVGASAIVLGSLVTGLQLSDVRELGDDSATLGGACLAAFGALTGVGTILFAAARVLVHPGWSLSRLSHLELNGEWNDHLLGRELDAQRGLLVHDDDLEPASLYRRFRAGRRAWTEFCRTGRATLTLDSGVGGTGGVYEFDRARDGDRERLRDLLDSIQAEATRVVTAANVVVTRHRYRVLLRLLLAVGVVVAGCVGSFAFLTAAEPEAPVTAPTSVELHFTDDLSAVRAAGLDEGCAGRTVAAVAVGGTFEQPLVVTRAVAGCRPHRLVVTPEVGLPVPQPRP